MDLTQSLIRSLIPIAKKNINNINDALVSRMDGIELQEGESYAAFVLTKLNGNCKVSTCTFTEEDKLSRQIDVKDLSDVIEQLLKLI